MNPWAYLVSDFLGIVIFVASLKAAWKTDRTTIAIAGCIFLLIPLILSHFFMDPVMDGVLNGLISLALLLITIFITIAFVICLISGLSSLMSKLFECVDGWLTRHKM